MRTAHARFVSHITNTLSNGDVRACRTTVLDGGVRPLHASRLGCQRDRDPDRVSTKLPEGLLACRRERTHKRLRLNDFLITYDKEIWTFSAGLAFVRATDSWVYVKTTKKKKQMICMFYVNQVRTSEVMETVAVTCYLRQIAQHVQTTLFHFKVLPPISPSWVIWTIWERKHLSKMCVVFRGDYKKNVQF